MNHVKFKKLKRLRDRIGHRSQTKRVRKTPTQLGSKRKDQSVRTALPNAPNFYLRMGTNPVTETFEFVFSTRDDGVNDLSGGD
jgi:hypothetical protein